MSNNNILKKIFSFVVQTLISLFIIPSLIFLVISLYSTFILGSFVEMRKLNILNNGGYTIILYQSFISPFLVVLSKYCRWKYIEFWYVIYCGLLVSYLLNGTIESTENNVIGPEFNFIFPFIYYELFYESSDLRNFIGLKNRYNVRKWFIQLLGKR